MLKNKNIALLGLGIENLALIKFILNQNINCQMTVCDSKNERELGEKYNNLKTSQNVHWQLSKEANKNLDSFAVLFRSPGWPLFDKELLAVKKMKVAVINPLEFFIRLCPSKNIIGVTGTKGKGTTASLIYHIIKQSGKRVWVAGNIGVAPFGLLKKIRKNDWVVLELSSFQLEDMQVSPHIAVLTNFFNEHLAPADPHNPNFHKTLADYQKAKMNIVRWQKKSDYSIFNFQFSIFKKISNIKSQKTYFKKSELPSKLIGEHNKENIAAAVAVAKIVGVKPMAINKAVANFKGLEHRLEFVKKIKDVKYYNDSFATTPESAATALKSFHESIVLLAGGAEKNSNFKELAKMIKRKVKYLVLFVGDATPRLKRDVVKAGFSKDDIRVVNSMKEAVAIARKIAKTGDIVLLSPACASFGMFRNYKERGNSFKSAVKSMSK